MKPTRRNILKAVAALPFVKLISGTDGVEADSFPSEVVPTLPPLATPISDPFKYERILCSGMFSLSMELDPDNQPGVFTHIADLNKPTWP